MITPPTSTNARFGADVAHGIDDNTDADLTV